MSFEIPAQSPSPTPEERAAELAVLEAEDRGRRRRRWVGAAAGCIVSAAMGAALIGYALHTTDEGWGEIAFWGGLLVGDVGCIASLLLAYLSAEDDAPR
jgi:hypothetical protein